MRTVRFGFIVAGAVALLPSLAWAQKREFVELQRDVAALQDQVRTLQTSHSENMGRVTALLQQAIDSINKVNTSVAVLDAAMRERDKSLAAPVAGVNTRVDSMANELQAMRVSIEDMNARLGKLQQGLVDLNNTIKVIQAPPSPPPATGAGSPGGSSAGPPAGVSSESLYSNAMRDKDTGKYDIALQEFSDYLRYYSSTELAPNAQYYIGEVYYNQRDYENALKAFDAVLERFPDNNKTLDAMYMKGRALFLIGEKTKAAQEFREVYSRAPRSELAGKAKAQLAAMGLSTNSAAPKKVVRRKK
jgi:tol-pal system protein YbgF